MRIARLRLFVIPLVAAALLLQGTPAHAGAGAGYVTGTVNTTPGVPIAPKAIQNNNFSFTATSITGTITATSTTGTTATFAGPVVVTASGSATDTGAGGTGVVNTLTGTGAGIAVSESPVHTSTFVRTGSLVLVGLWLNVTVTGPTGTTASQLLYVEVIANFVPISTNAATTHITSAAFVGVWAAA